MSKQLQELDFDSWLDLSQRDPDHFEIQRQNLIAEAIAKAPKERQQRLRGLQWRIEHIRQRAKTPMAACISISDLMWDIFAGENGLQSTLTNSPSVISQKRPKADILTFQRKAKDE